MSWRYPYSPFNRGAKELQGLIHSAAERFSRRARARARGRLRAAAPASELGIGTDGWPWSRGRKRRLPCH